MNRCPVSGSPGAPVDLQTVKALLTESALQRVVPGEYCFCADPRCDIVYFGSGGSPFTTADVRVPVWQKQPFGQRPICYCFGESEASIRSEFESAGKSMAAERVREHIAAQRCACELRNPRGACCLGDLIAATKRVEASIGVERVGGRAGLRRAELGALGTAGTVAATILCCLPFATGIIGAGVAAFGARLAPFHPYLAALSLALVGYSLYGAYRPGAVACTGGRCNLPSAWRYRRVTAWLTTVVVVLLLTVSWWANWVIYWTL